MGAEAAYTHRHVLVLEPHGGDGVPRRIERGSE